MHWRTNFTSRQSASKPRLTCTPSSGQACPSPRPSLVFTSTTWYGEDAEYITYLLAYLLTYLLACYYAQALDTKNALGSFVDGNAVSLLLLTLLPLPMAYWRYNQHKEMLEKRLQMLVHMDFAMDPVLIANATTVAATVTINPILRAADTEPGKGTGEGKVQN